MADVMRLIEYVFSLEDDMQTPYIGLFDARDISSIIQYDKKHCKIILKDGRDYIACGNLRTLTNRWIYTLEKKHSLYHDDIIRPSVMIFHKPETMGVDSAYFDAFQLKQFILALRPELLDTYSDIFQGYEL